MHLLQNLTKKLWNFTEVYFMEPMKFHEISWYKKFAFVHSRCTLMTFTFTFCTFKSWPQNLGLIRTDSKCQLIKVLFTYLGCFYFEFLMINLWHLKHTKMTSWYYNLARNFLISFEWNLVGVILSISALRLVKKEMFLFFKKDNKYRF